MRTLPPGSKEANMQEILSYTPAGYPSIVSELCPAKASDGVAVRRNPVAVRR
jgi:hypothetical protein